jgi:hypothetical protein
MLDFIFAVSFLANLIFILIIVATGFFLIRSFKDGYWGKHGEDVKYQMFDEDGKRKKT